MNKRTIVIGDVHGCLNELKSLLNKVEFVPVDDRCIIVGDLVDRGPFSVETVAWCKNNNIEVVIGNHDDKYVRYHKHELKKLENPKYNNPMKFGFHKLQIYDGLVKAGLVEWLSNLPSWIFIEEYNAYCVHAGIFPSNHAKLEFHSRKEHLLTRYINHESSFMMNLTEDHRQPINSIHWSEIYKGSENIIYGHHPFTLSHPHIVKNESNARTFGIDTGCCFGGMLTALVLEGSIHDFNETFIQIKSYKVYHDK